MARDDVRTLVPVVAALVVSLLSSGAQSGSQCSMNDDALTGVVRSEREEAMEGVLVTLRRGQGPVATTVVSDKRGRFTFPRSHICQARRGGPRNLDSGLSDSSIVFQAAVPKPVVPKYTTSGVRRPREL